MRVATTYNYINTLLSLIHFYSLSVIRCFYLSISLMIACASKNVVYCCRIPPEICHHHHHRHHPPPTHPINDFVLVDYLLLNSRRAFSRCLFPDSLVVVSKMCDRERAVKCCLFCQFLDNVVLSFVLVSHTHNGPISRLCVHTYRKKATVDHPSIPSSPRAHMLLCRMHPKQINQSSN